MSEKTTAVEDQENATGSRGELKQLLAEFRSAMLVTRDDQGMPRARPMAIVRCDDDASLWFATSDHAPKVDEVARDPNVAVLCFRERDKAWISISGKASLVRDKKKTEELWDPMMKVWFTGPDDPSILLVRVAPVHAEYYESDQTFVGRVLEMAKGVIINAAPKMGTVKHVDLERLSEPGRITR